MWMIHNDTISKMYKKLCTPRTLATCINSLTLLSDFTIPDDSRDVVY